MILIIFAMVIWGSLGMFVLWSKLPMIDIAFFRCIIGASFLGIYCYYKGYFRLFKLDYKALFLVILSGVFLAINWVLLFESFQLASITIGNVSYYLQPVFLILLGILFFKEKISSKKWLFIFLSFVGVVMTTGVSYHNISMHHTLLIGACFAVLAGLFYAFVTILVKPVTSFSPPMITLIQLLVGSIVLLPLMNFNLKLSITTTTVFIMLLIGIVHTALAYIFYYQGVKQVSVSNIAILSYIDPVVAIFTDVMFFGRELNAYQITGVALTLIFSFKASFTKQKVRYDVS